MECRSIRGCKLGDPVKDVVDFGRMDGIGAECELQMSADGLEDAVFVDIGRRRDVINQIVLSLGIAMESNRI